MRGGVNHVDLTMADPARSRPFYDAVLGFFGYRRTNERPAGCDYDLETEAGFCSIGIVAASEAGAGRPHDRYSPGLHHLALNADSRVDVDRFHDLLVEIGATVLDTPAEYPLYGEGYYAVFFADPDGLKLEVVHWPQG